MMTNVVLTDEWDTGLVTLWSLEKLTERSYVPAGTSATVVSQTLSGYILVEISGEYFEVWHEAALNPVLN